MGTRKAVQSAATRAELKNSARVLFAERAAAGGVVTDIALRTHAPSDRHELGYSLARSIPIAGHGRCPALAPPQCVTTAPLCRDPMIVCCSSTLECSQFCSTPAERNGLPGAHQSQAARRSRRQSLQMTITPLLPSRRTTCGHMKHDRRSRALRGLEPEEKFEERRLRGAKSELDSSCSQESLSRWCSNLVATAAATASIGVRSNLGFARNGRGRAITLR